MRLFFTYGRILKRNWKEDLNKVLFLASHLMMCKKCFLAFERHHTLAKLIINKMKSALSVLKQDV